MRVATIVLAVLVAATTTARSSPPIDFGWLQGDWECDVGGYERREIMPLAGRAAGRSSMTMSWHTPADDVQYELRRSGGGTWKLLGRAVEKGTHDYVAWDLAQRAAGQGDVTFEGTARYMKAGVRTDVPIRWRLIDTGDGGMAEWRWYYRDNRWTDARSRHCQRVSATR